MLTTGYDNRTLFSTTDNTCGVITVDLCEILLNERVISHSRQKRGLGPSMGWTGLGRVGSTIYWVGHVVIFLNVTIYFSIRIEYI